MMSYTVHKLNEAGRWAWVADCTAGWMPTEDLLAEARVDARAKGPGRYCVIQTSDCGSEVERHEFDINPKADIRRIDQLPGEPCYWSVNVLDGGDVCRYYYETREQARRACAHHEVGGVEGRIG